jgi:hypothetical protein
MYNRNRAQFKSDNKKVSNHNLSQRIAFLVDGRVDQNLKIIESYIRKLQNLGKDVTLLYLTDHANPEQVSFQAFNSKSFNWYYIPKAPVVIDFIRKDFDMIISINPEQIPELDAIIDLSNAKFKTGVIPGHNDLFDLVINPVNENTWQSYIKILEDTLDQLSVKKQYAYS